MNDVAQSRRRVRAKPGAEAASISPSVPSEPGLSEGGDNIDETNFRFHAKRVLERYSAKGQIVDAMIWGTIVRHYEALLVRAKEESGARGQ